MQTDVREYMAHLKGSASMKVKQIPVFAKTFVDCYFGGLQWGCPLSTITLECAMGVAWPTAYWCDARGVLVSDKCLP